MDKYIWPSYFNPSLETDKSGRRAMALDRKTLQLLSCLRMNSREKLTAISKKTNLPISTLFDLLQEVQNDIITKSTVLLNYETLGFHARAQVLMKVSHEHKERLRNHLVLHTEVNSLYKVNNDWDFIVETVHHNIKELDEFLEELCKKFKIEQKEIHYLIDEVKKEGFLLA